MPEDIAQNLAAIREVMVRTCACASRPVEEISVVAVTKGVRPARILECYRQGMRLFGESRVQEAKAKILELPRDLIWHMIGHVQTNKAQEAVQLFRMIQSVDSLKLAARLHRLAEAMGIKVPVLVEVNVAKESSKFGFFEEELEDVFLKLKEWNGLEVKGLMTVAPFREVAEETRPFFRRMKELFDRRGDLEILSMGMSHDYAVAIEEGSTMVRLGQAIFGPRL